MSAPDLDKLRAEYEEFRRERRRIVTLEDEGKADAKDWQASDDHAFQLLDSIAQALGWDRP